MPETPPSRKEVVGFGAVLGLAGVLVAIHFLLPDPLHQALVFDHERFRVYTLWTAAYVHAGNEHLFSNILGFLLPTLYVYILCISVDEQRWFRRTFLVFLALLPVLVSLSSFLIFSTRFPRLSPTSQGFSGVAAGFGGFLLVALTVYIRNRYSHDLAQVIGTSIFLVLMLIVDIIYSGRIRLVVGGLVVLGISLQIGAYVWENGVSFEGLAIRAWIIDVTAVFLVSVVLAYLVVALFPVDIVSDGKTTNIFAHAAGFIYGILLSSGAYMYTS